MTTAYSGEPGDGNAGLSLFKDWIPFDTTLRDETPVQVGPFEESEWNAGMTLMNHVIQEGRSWPFESEFETLEAYRGYFLSHAAFVVRCLETKEVAGCFYIKPNFPGRCSHICNGGFITHPDYRRRGVAHLMGKVFLKAAHQLGYKSAYFNLVFQSNEASVALWESLGFQRVAVLEQAARLKGLDKLDTAYGYRYDLEKMDESFSLR
jgi:RimJ/RimL family protein N-acetyltransferase